jgi:hypothetical protein
LVSACHWYIAFYCRLLSSVDARKQLAEKSFKIIGKQIKTRRMSDFHDIMKSRLPENFELVHRHDEHENNVRAIDL